MTGERRRLSDPNLIWIMKEVLPPIIAEMAASLSRVLAEHQAAQAAANIVRDEKLDRITAAVHSLALSCVAISAFTAVAASAVTFWLWR